MSSAAERPSAATIHYQTASRSATSSAALPAPLLPVGADAAPPRWHLMLNLLLGATLAVAVCVLVTGLPAVLAAPAEATRGALGAPRNLDACLVQAAVDYQTRWQRNCRILGYGADCLLAAETASVFEGALAADRQVCLSRYGGR